MGCYSPPRLHPQKHVPITLGGILYLSLIYLGCDFPTISVRVPHVAVTAQPSVFDSHTLLWLPNHQGSSPTHFYDCPTISVRVSHVAATIQPLVTVVESHTLLWLPNNQVLFTGDLNSREINLPGMALYLARFSSMSRVSGMSGMSEVRSALHHQCCTSCWAW